MKRRQGLAFVLFFLFAVAVVAPVVAQDDPDIQQFKACKYCGMDRKMFAHSRVFIEYDDGTKMGLCSIHCAAVDLAQNIDKTPATIMVGDFNTKKLIDAEQAFWVIGGDKPGVMTKRAKWAFENKADAEAYVKASGGAVATFDDVVKAAYEDMHNDTKMIRDKRRAKRMQMQEQQPKKQ